VTTAQLRRSVEVEYWVIDDEGRLTEPGDLAAAPGAEREFVEPLLEIKTTPCATTAELRAELFERVGAVLRRAEAAGKGLVPLATPLHSGEIRDLDDRRTEIQAVVIGEDFEYVRHCAGTHVHVEQLPGRAVDQLNALIALDPALALVNSSPYFRGDHLAAGARSKLYRWMAYEGVAHQGRLWPYATDTDQWRRRLERRYGEFATAAIGAGFDRATVEDHFDPESAVWTPVQLRDSFGTVEWRSPDTALPSQVVRLADDLAGVVEQLRDADVRIDRGTGRVTDSAVLLPEFETVLGHVEAAIRDGLASGALRSYLERMGFDTGTYEPLTAEFDGRGRIDRREARRLRLEYADRLRNDLGRVAAAGD
jgi:hypothetical protein